MKLEKEKLILSSGIWIFIGFQLMHLDIYWISTHAFGYKINHLLLSLVFSKLGLSLSVFLMLLESHGKVFKDFSNWLPKDSGISSPPPRKISL